VLVTCIVVSHDKPDLCHEAIQSLVDQTHTEWQGLVMDSGVLIDGGYFDSFPWSTHPRLTFLRSGETPRIRRTRAMAPWCFNECFRRGLVRGELVMYLCDDDLLYPKAFETFVSYAEAQPAVLAMYASQDIGMIYPDGSRAVVGERRAVGLAGRSCRGRPLDCQVDYLQFCHRREILRFFRGKEYWPEGKRTESHADGIFMERCGRYVPVHPIDVKVGQNRRTPQSTYLPARADGLATLARRQP
jgi:spore maturation protein CgeD